MVKKVAALLVVVLVSLALGQVELAKQKPAGFDPKRDAAKDIAEAVKRAGKQNKRVLIDVGGEWCIWCHRLEEFFEANKDVAKYRDQNFIWVKVNFSQENKNEAVLSQYPKIPGYPHIFVLERDGKLLHSQDTGLLETGDHHDRDKVFDFLKKWAPKVN